MCACVCARTDVGVCSDVCARVRLTECELPCRCVRVSVCVMCVLVCVQLYVCQREAVCARVPARRRRGPAGRQGAELCRWRTFRGTRAAAALPQEPSRRRRGRAHAGRARARARAGRGAGPGRALGGDGDRGPPLTCLRGSGCRARPTRAAAENLRALPSGTWGGSGGKGPRRELTRPWSAVTMLLLALGAGRRLDVLHPSGALCLQTLLWILCAAVCGAEQYFNVEVRTGRPPRDGPRLTRSSPRVPAALSRPICTVSPPAGQTWLCFSISAMDSRRPSPLSPRHKGCFERRVPLPPGEAVAGSGRQLSSSSG